MDNNQGKPAAEKSIPQKALEAAGYFLLRGPLWSVIRAVTPSNGSPATKDIEMQAMGTNKPRKP